MAKVRLAVTVDEYLLPQLKHVALKLGYMKGDKPNISAMLNDIAAGNLIVKHDEWLQNREHNALKAIKGVQENLAKLYELL